MPLTDLERKHIRSRFNSAVAVVKTGELLEVTYVNSQPAPRRPGRRKGVTAFSPSARLRMLKRMACVHWESVGPSLFITLTYRDEDAITTKEQRTEHRSRLFRDMEKHLGKEIGALWRIEWQDRKSGKLMGTMVPHVHLIVFDCRWLPWDLLSKLWQGACRADGPPRVDVQRIRGQRDVAKYVAKYAAKVNPAHNLVIASYLNIQGRHWGIHRADLIPWCVRTWDLRYTPEEIALLENVAASKIPYFPKGTRSGFSLFGPIVKKVTDEIHARRIDKLKGAG